MALTRLAARAEAEGLPLRCHHLDLERAESVADIELEQELDRPYAYVAKARYRDNYARGMDIIDISDPAKPRLLKRWPPKKKSLSVRWRRPIQVPMKRIVQK